MKIIVTTILATVLVLLSSQCVWADTAKPLVNQKEWDEAVERLGLWSHSELPMASWLSTGAACPRALITVVSECATPKQ